MCYDFTFKSGTLAEHLSWKFRVWHVPADLEMLFFVFLGFFSKHFSWDLQWSLLRLLCRLDLHSHIEGLQKCVESNSCGGQSAAADASRCVLDMWSSHNSEPDLVLELLWCAWLTFWFNRCQRWHHTDLQNPFLLRMTYTIELNCSWYVDQYKIRRPGKPPLAYTRDGDNWWPCDF